MVKLFKILSIVTFLKCEYIVISIQLVTTKINVQGKNVKLVMKYFQ